VRRDREASDLREPATARTQRRQLGFVEGVGGKTARRVAKQRKRGGDGAADARHEHRGVAGSGQARGACRTPKASRDVDVVNEALGLTKIVARDGEPGRDGAGVGLRE